MKRFLFIAVMAWLSTAVAPARAQLKVFACVPEWGALAQELGGDKVSVYLATHAQQDPHRVEARPSLVARMRNADMLVCNGADLEVGWLPVLLQSAGNRKVLPGQPGHFLAAELVTKLEVPTRLDRAEGDVHPQGNPHIQLDPRNIATVAEALARRLAQIDAPNAAHYNARGADFQKRWAAALQKWSADAAVLKGRKVVGYHRSATYLLHWLEMIEVLNIEPKPGVPPSSGHLAGLLSSLKAMPAEMILRMAYNDPKAPQWLAERTGLPVVELPYTVGGTPGARDLFGLFDDSIARLRKAVGR